MSARSRATIWRSWFSPHETLRSVKVITAMAHQLKNRTSVATTNDVLEISHRGTPAVDAQCSEAQVCEARRGAALLRQWRIPERCAAVIPGGKAVVPARIGGR